MSTPLPGPGSAAVRPRSRLVLILGGIAGACAACTILSVLAAVVSPPRPATPTVPGLPAATVAATTAPASTATAAPRPATATIVAVPTATAPPPPPPTGTARPPTATAAPPTETAPPAANYVASASVDKPAPPQGATVRVTGKLLKDGQPVAGVWMRTRWIYKSSENSCEAKTNAQGSAACSRDIGARVTVGYEVTIRVRFEDADGHLLATTDTTFTPK